MRSCSRRRSVTDAACPLRVLSARFCDFLPHLVGADALIGPYMVQRKSMMRRNMDQKKLPLRQTRIRTTTKYRSGQEKSFRETGRTSLLTKSLLVYALEPCNKNANCIQASVLPFCLCRHPSRRMQYNDLLNQRTICRRDCHEREKIICIHAHGLGCI